MMPQRATGTFEVNLTPLSPSEAEAEAGLGRLSLDKQFHGDLAAVSKGTMMAAQTTVEGSAGYVALERVTGQLHGCSGSFVFQHNGLMNRSEPQLTITVVPDSGTGELRGIAGDFTLTIVDGKHSYTFDYTLPA